MGSRGEFLFRRSSSALMVRSQISSGVPPAPMVNNFPDR
jgi:hypothetical protein